MLTSASSVTGPCPPYLYLGLRGRASLPDVHRKQGWGWGWAGQGGEENGGLSREAVQDSHSSLCSSLEPPTPGTGHADRAAGIVPESNAVTAIIMVAANIN